MDSLSNIRASELHQDQTRYSLQKKYFQQNPFTYNEFKEVLSAMEQNRSAYSEFDPIFRKDCGILLQEPDSAKIYNRLNIWKSDHNYGAELYQDFATRILVRRYLPLTSIDQAISWETLPPASKRPDWSSDSFSLGTSS